MKHRIIKRRIAVFLQIALLLMMCFPAVVMAEGSTAIDISLSKNSASVGDNIVVSGTTIPGAWVPLKVIDTAGNIAVFDATKADADGSYSMEFIVPNGASGTLTVVAGEGSKVAAHKLSLATPHTPDSPGGGGGGGGISPDKPMVSTTGKAVVKPGAGGTISLGNEAAIEIPANALKGTEKVEVKVKKVTDTPKVPTGFRLVGSVYDFSVGDQSSYSFAKEVTIILYFDPDQLQPGETPAIYYYDENEKQWVYLGGTISGNSITVKVQHFTKFAVMAELEAIPVITPGDILSDITGHWAEESVKELVALEAISGYADGTFKPDNIITRAEFATIIVKAFKLAPQNGKVFADTAGHWAQDVISTAAYYGIVNGYDADTFGPNDVINREQMAVMIVKAANLPPAQSEISFADNSSISSWAKDAVVAAVNHGIISGYPDNTVRPQGNATRAEAATVIVKALHSI